MSKSLKYYIQRACRKTLAAHNKDRFNPTGISLLLEKLIIFFEYGFVPDFKHPKTWTEYICGQKFYGDFERMASVSDKLKVRAYVEEKIGKQYLNKLLGVYNSVDEITKDVYNQLPEQFVVKPNHASERIYVNQTDDYEKMNRETRGFMEEFGNMNNEFHYKRIKKKLLIEKYLLSKDTPLHEYKFWVFKGRVQFIVPSINIHESKKTGNYHFRLFDRNFSEPIVQVKSPPSMKVSKPERLDEMIKIAEQLAEGWDFLRIDLYMVKNKIIFSELTPTPSAGRTFFFSLEDQKKLYDRLLNE